MSIIVTIGMFLGVLSLAEVASMAPTSGGQYRTYPRCSAISDRQSSCINHRLGLGNRTETDTEATLVCRWLDGSAWLAGCSTGKRLHFRTADPRPDIRLPTELRDTWLASVSDNYWLGYLSDSFKRLRHAKAHACGGPCRSSAYLRFGGLPRNTVGYGSPGR